VTNVEVDLLTGQHNYAVLRLPERHFPGVLVQGDSLYILYTKAAQALRDLDADPDEARESMAAIVEQLRDLVHGYAVVLRRHGLPLPFFDQDISDPNRPAR
jgi:hypothetical protein